MNKKLFIAVFIVLIHSTGVYTQTQSLLCHNDNKIYQKMIYDSIRLTKANGSLFEKQMYTLSFQVNNFINNIDSMRTILPHLLTMFHIAYSQRNKPLTEEMVSICENVLYSLNTLANSIMIITYLTDSYSFPGFTSVPYSVDDWYSICMTDEPNYQQRIFCLHWEFLIAAAQLETLFSTVPDFLNELSLHYLFTNQDVCTKLQDTVEKINSTFHMQFSTFTVLTYNMWYMYQLIQSGQSEPAK